MKILHVIPSLGLQRGGPSVVARALATGLARAGVAVEVVATDDDGPGRLNVPLNQPVVEDGVTYRFFPRQTRFYTASLPLARWLDRNVAAYDVVHIHALFSFASLAAARAARRHGVPYIIRPLGTLNRWGMHNRRPLLKQISFQLLERQALSKAAAVHFTTEQERIEASQLGVPHHPVVIPLPVELPGGTLATLRGQLVRRYPQLAGHTVVLFLSRLDPKKGLDLLIPAFAGAHRDDPRLALVIAGSGEPGFVDGLKALAEREGVATHVIWTGFVEGEEKLALLAGADLFVLPSYSENFGIAAVEAMAAGLPVILSDQVGIHHDVTHAAAGLIVPCTVAPLAAALVTLSANPTLRTQLGSNARRLASSAYSPAAVSNRLVELYGTIVNNGSTHAEEVI